MLGILLSVSTSALIITGLTLAGMAYLLYHSRVLRRPGYSVPMVLGAGLSILGIQFTISHYPYSAALLTAGGLLIALPYALWFGRHRPSGLLAGLKLAWLLSIGVGLIWFAYRLPGWRTVAASPSMLFWAVLLLSIYQRHISGRKKEE